MDINHDFEMEALEEETREERVRQARRRARLEQARREKRRALFIQRRVVPMAGLLVLGLMLWAGFAFFSGDKADGKDDSGAGQESLVSGENRPGEDGFEALSPSPGQQGGQSGNLQGGQSEGLQGDRSEGQQPELYRAERTGSTAAFPEEVVSEYGLLIDVEKQTILAGQEEKTRISPASMTKIWTIWTAADALGITGEAWEDNPVLDETFTITIQITDYSYVNDCSNVGFEVGEEVSVRDLFYGTIMPSGADAALGLACYVSGSHEAFVELMNRKLEELGMGESSHMTNCVGLYDKEHYSTAYDVAMMLKTATDNPFCREVMSRRVYTTEGTKEHPEGMILSNWFLRRIEDKDTHGEVLCAKTGFVVQSKNCAASLATDGAGREYICVTAGSSSSWRCIYDHVALYQQWLPEAEADAAAKAGVAAEANAEAESFYVLTKTLPVYASAAIRENAGAAPLETLSRGDTVEWLQEGDGENTYCRIKTARGTEGYVWFDCVASMTKKQFEERKDKVVVIDPGHQGRGSSEKEPVGPGATRTKARVAAGTSGIATKVPEHQLTLAVSLQLEEKLEELGYVAVMLRRSADIDISNRERALIANDLEADALIRIHADGSANPAANGAMTITCTKHNPYEVANYYEAGKRLSACVLEAYSEACGISANRILESDSYSGINWCMVPVTILEMGFMTNPEEDTRMQNPEFQATMAEGIVKGLVRYLENPAE